MDLYGINKIVITNPKNGGQGGEGYTKRAKVALFIKPDLGGCKGYLGAPLRPDRFQKMWIFHISSDSPGARACRSHGCLDGSQRGRNTLRTRQNTREGLGPII